jgi:hypothetical protein
MMPISSPFRNPSLMSARTAKYVEAMIRQGDGFNYDEWLRRVREEEAHAKQLPAASDSGHAGAAGQIGHPVSKSANRDSLPRSGRALLRPISVPRVLSRCARKMSDKQPKARLKRWLEKVQVALKGFQANRARDAVYGYLEAVFARRRFPGAAPNTPILARVPPGQLGLWITRAPLPRTLWPFCLCARKSLFPGNGDQLDLRLVRRNTTMEIKRSRRGAGRICFTQRSNSRNPQK